jgi:small subunit ribosomal protein S9
MEQENIFYATGKRKSAIARTRLIPGTGNITINGRPADNYFALESARAVMDHPFNITNTLGSFDVIVRVNGGGTTGQAQAIRHGISRALEKVDAANRLPLKRAGLLRRDARVKERKKYGQPGARARFQFSKR